MEADFSGYATKAGLKCSDGRTITPEAFKHMDGMTVPLVWQHGHNTPKNVLGHAKLEARDDGVYAYGFFNATPEAKSAKTLVEHKDIVAMSIYANQLVEKSKSVLHGVIREVSLVLSGANPGALIDQVRIAHSDGEIETLDDEAFIYSGEPIALEHSSEETDEEDEEDDEDLEHSAQDPTVQEVYDSLDDQQKEVVHFMIGAALEAAGNNSNNGSAQHSDLSDDESEDESDNNEDNLAHQEGTEMTNVFERGAAGNGTQASPTLSHSQIETILDDAKKPGMTLKDSFMSHAAEYGITDIELLFPDAKAMQNSPQFISRRMEWVSKVLGGTTHTPFQKLKTILADITAEEARAKGYVKGNQKVEEVFGLLKRTTGPATIYKKQKLDRDDIIDITDLDVVAFLKAEMRLMIEEEVARAILVGDGRSNLSADKVKDPAGAVDGTGIRSILNDDDLYSIKTTLAANVSPKDAVKGMVRARTGYRGSGKPTMFISDAQLTDIMLEEDKFGRPLYETEQVLADKLRVSEIVTVDLFDEYPNLFCIMVSLSDYWVGSTRGGELTSFEDFDIDFNQNKYLQETRLSGALTKPYSAIVVFREVGTEATPQAPSFDGATNTITIPTVTGVDYLIDNSVATGSVTITSPTEVDAVAKDGYYIAPNTTRSWTYTPS